MQSRLISFLNGRNMHAGRVIPCVPELLGALLLILLADVLRVSVFPVQPIFIMGI